MKYLIMLCMCFILCGVHAQSPQAKLQTSEVFLFGVVYSFADSTTYLTDIQHLPQAQIERTSKKLIGLSSLSKQLKQYVQQSLGGYNIITAVYYEREKNKIETEFVKLRKQLTKRVTKPIQPISKTDFIFTLTPQSLTTVVSKP